MSRSQRARWWNSIAFVAVGVVLGALLALAERPQTAALVLASLVIAAWLVAPVRTSEPVHHWEAQERLVRDGRVIVYWRPGCLFCARLRLRLGPLARRATWVDIWADPEAAAFVRDLNGGAEVVPTVILTDGEARTNPDPARVRAELEGWHRHAA